MQQPQKKQQQQQPQQQKRLPIPESVRQQAAVGVKLLDAGFSGGTRTGWKRATQLANDKTISVADLAVMRSWFARHGPDAKTGGTSYPGYLRWLRDGSPSSLAENDALKNKYRGAVAWLIWGGDAAYSWLKTPVVRTALLQAFPSRKIALQTNRLQKRI